MEKPQNPVDNPVDYAEMHWMGGGGDIITLSQTKKKKSLRHVACERSAPNIANIIL